MKKIVLNIEPVAKPRMTRSDKWKQRPVVQKYWQYKDAIRNADFKMPEPPYKITFFIAMPKSWSKKKKQEHDGKPHLSRPDRDNLEKGFNDALHDEDSHLWSAWVEKRWSYEPRIEIKIFDINAE